MKTFCGKIVSGKGTKYDVYLDENKFENTESRLVWVSAKELDAVIGSKGYRNVGNHRALNEKEALTTAQEMVDSSGFE